MEEKIDILLATYNGEKYLKEQLDSILNQTYKNIRIIIKKGGFMGNLKEKILKEEIKMYFVSENKLGIYGKTYEVRDELKNAGAIWNSEKKRLEIDEDKFKEMDNEIIEKVFELREKQRQSGIEHISQLLLSGELKAFLDKDDNYQLYGNVKNITRELNNVGFKFADKNYAIKRDDFDRIFSNEVKEVVNEYNKAQEKETKETSNEIIYEETEEEVEY